MAINFVQTAVGALMVVGGAASLRGTGKEEKILPPDPMIKKAQTATDAIREAVRQDKITKEKWIKIFEELDLLLTNIDRQIMWSWARLVWGKATGAALDFSGSQQWFEKTLSDLPLTWQNKNVLGLGDSSLIDCPNGEIRLNLAWARMKYFYDLFRSSGTNYLATQLPGFMDAFSDSGPDYQKFLSYWQIIKHCRATLLNPDSEVVDGYKLNIVDYRDIGIYEIDLGSLVAEGSAPIVQGYAGRARASFDRRSFIVGQTEIQCNEYTYLPNADIPTHTVKGAFSGAVQSANATITYYESGIDASSWKSLMDAAKQTIREYAVQFVEFVIDLALNAIGTSLAELPKADADQAKGTGRKIVGAGLIVGGSVVMIGGLRS
ncbi:MAG: hypothetical protein V3V46_09365 [Anaerolineales bacterium]